MLNCDGIDRNVFAVQEQPRNLYCNSFVATAIVGAGIVGAGATIYASGKAADAQTAAADKAANTSLSMYNTTRGDLAPYRDMGQNASDELQRRLPFLTSPIVFDRSILDNPNNAQGASYQFNRTQGLKSTQNSAAARGLGVSGAALKGAAAFGTGLADNTFKTGFDIENANRTNAYTRLKGLVDTGETAAAQGGVLGASAANTAASAQIGAGNAAAAGINAAGGAINTSANNIGGYFAYKGLYGGGPSASSNINPLNNFDPTMG